MLAKSANNLCRWCVATAAIVAISSPAHAQATKSFNIPSQPLDAALEAFGLQSGAHIMFDKGQVRGKASTPVVGSMAPSEALNRLISGTGMRASQANATTFVIGSSSQAPADPPPLTSETAVAAELIVTGQNSRLSPNLESFPGSVTVVGHEEVKTQLSISSDIGQLLESKIPGLGASSRGASDANQTLRGRGLSYYVDGVPISNPLREGGREMRTVPASALDGVEVIRGASALYGNGGNGGSVNYITVRPWGPDGVSGATTASDGGSLTHIAGSWDPELQQDLQIVHGPFDLVMSGSVEQTNGFFDGDGDRIASDPTGNGGINDSRIYDAFIQAGVNLGVHRIEASLIYYDQEQKTDWGNEKLGSQQLGIKSTAALGQVDPRVAPQYTENTVEQISYINKDFLDGAAKVQLFHTRDIQLYSWNATRAAQSYIFSEKNGLRTDLNTPINKLGFGEGKVLWGAEFTEDQTGQSVNTTPAKVWVPYLDVKNYAAFAQLEISPVEHLHLQGGVRYDDFRVGVPTFTVLNTTLKVTGGRLTYDDVVFNAGASYEINPMATVYGGFSQGFSLPDIGLVLRAATVTNVLSTLRPEPIKVNNYEIGIRGEILDARYTLATYLSTSKLGQSFVPDRVDPLIKDVVRSAEHIWGAEATLDGHWFEPRRGKWGGTFTWVDGRVDTNGDGKVDSPFTNDRVGPIKITGYVSIEVAPDWPARLQGIYSGDRNEFPPSLYNKSTGNYGHIHSYAVFDLLTSHKLGPGDASLAITNIFNSQYFNVAAQLSGNFPSRYVPAPGAGFRVSYRLKY